MIKIFKKIKNLFLFFFTSPNKKKDIKESRKNKKDEPDNIYPMW
jgi:hypothetical protein